MPSSSHEALDADGPHDGCRLGEADITVSDLPEDSDDAPGSDSELRERHRQLKFLIHKCRKGYQKKKAVLTDSGAVDALMDLRALELYNDKYLILALERNSVKRHLDTARPLMKSKLRKRWKGIRPATTASNTVAAQCCKTQYYARRLRKMAVHMENTGELLRGRRGQGAQHDSLLNKPEVKAAVERWYKGEVPVNEGGFEGPVSTSQCACSCEQHTHFAIQMRPAKLRRYLNDFLFPRLGLSKTICETTAMQWMKKAGFKMVRIKKGVYVDGHERDDVVAYRKDFIQKIFKDVLP
jgi:hypothetical protein